MQQLIRKGGEDWTRFTEINNSAAAFNLRPPSPPRVSLSPRLQAQLRGFDAARTSQFRPPNPATCSPAPASQLPLYLVVLCSLPYHDQTESFLLSKLTPLHEQYCRSQYSHLCAVLSTGPSRSRTQEQSTEGGKEHKARLCCTEHRERKLTVLSTVCFAEGTKDPPFPCSSRGSLADMEAPGREERPLVCPGLEACCHSPF